MIPICFSQAKDDSEIMNRRNRNQTRVSNKYNRRALKGNLDMMSRRRILFGLACLLLSVGTCQLWAQESVQLKIGIVNVERLEKDYKVLQEKQKELDALRSQSAETLREVSQYAFLSAELFKEVVALVSLPKPWPEEKAKRAEELRKISEEKEKEYLALRSNTVRTPEQEDRFKTLQELVEARDSDMRQLEQNFLQDLLNRQRELQTQLLARVRETIVAVAKEKKYDLVLDNTVVFFGGEDITDAVIELLNRTQPAAAEQPKPEEQGGAGGK